MTLGHGDRRWTARLRQILPAPHKPVGPQGVNDANGSKGNVANNVVLYTALFDVDNAAGDLRPEMTAQVFFVVAQTKDAVIAPVTALRASADGGTTVSVVDAEGRESERTVQVGLRTRFRVEITKGLAPGERVVTGRKADSGKAPLVSFHL
jgi:macrolide-specific efflux system membrane fusion protein